MKCTWLELPVGEISVVNHPRREAGNLDTLEGSIRRLGVLQPLMVDRRNRLISGYRRLLAARKAGLAAVPVLRVDAEADTLAAADIQSDENLCRLALSPAELEGLIQRKQGLVKHPDGAGSGWLTCLQWLKRLFSPS